MDELTGLPEFDGNLMNLMFEKASKPESGIFTKPLIYHTTNLIKELGDTFRAFTENLIIATNVEREEPEIIKVRLIEINKSLYGSFKAFIDLLAFTNYDPDRLTLKFHEYLEEINFHEAYGNTRILLGLFNYSKHSLLYDWGIYPKSFMPFDFYTALEKKSILLKGLSKYTPEFLPIVSVMLSNLLIPILSILYNESTVDSKERQNKLDIAMVGLTKNLFLLYSFAEIDEDYLCQWYKQNN